MFPIRRRFGAFSSSSNPEQLADTVKGTILGMSVIIIFAAKTFFHIELTSEDIMQFAINLSSVFATTWVAYGLVKKFIVYIIDKWNNRDVQDSE